MGVSIFYLSEVMKSASFCKVVESPQKKVSRCMYCCLIFLLRYATILSSVLPNEGKERFECYSSIIDAQQLTMASFK